MDWISRIRFIETLEVMEVDFSDVAFDDVPSVNAAFDALEAELDRRGRKWYFVVNETGRSIGVDAWFNFGYRAKKLHHKWALHSVRYDTSPQTAAELAQQAEDGEVDPDLFDSRDDALARTAGLQAKRPGFVQQRPKETAHVGSAEFAKRLTFDPARRIMEADFSEFTFQSPADVDAFFDFIEHEVWKTAEKWFFLVNFENCRIWPEAWTQYANRGRKLNQKSSLGSVRYDASPGTARQMREFAEAGAADPNLCATRAEALNRIAELSRDLDAPV